MRLKYYLINSKLIKAYTISYIIQLSAGERSEEIIYFSLPNDSEIIGITSYQNSNTAWIVLQTGLKDNNNALLGVYNTSSTTLSCMAYITILYI